jgi:hypothetical protein
MEFSPQIRNILRDPSKGSPAALMLVFGTAGHVKKFGSEAE